MNPPSCPGCSAPLDPLATKCPYCNLVTPKGRAEAERAEYEARARQAQGQAYAAAQASMAQAAASQEVSKSANYALIATIVGFVSCCSPVGWLGGFFAYRSLSLAGKHGIPKPVSAIVSAVLAVLGTLMTIGVFVGSHFDQKDKEKRIATIEARCKDARTKASLDAKTACDVAEAYLLTSNKMTTSAAMVCQSTPTVNGATASLDSVAVLTNGKTQATYRICLVKGARWFVVHADTTTDECLDEAPAATTDAEEQFARDTYAGLVEKARLNRADKRLGGAKGAVDRAASTDRTCDAAALARTNGGTVPVVRAIDYAVLDGKDDPNFAFLSNKELLEYFTKGKLSAKEKSDLASKLTRGTPFLAVYKHKSRTFPEVSEKGDKSDYGFSPGEYDGTLYVVDTSRVEVICQGPLLWKTPAKPPFAISRKSTRGVVEDRAKVEFEHRFQDAATERMKALSGGKLRLGYKPIE